MPRVVPTTPSVSGQFETSEGCAIRTKRAPVVIEQGVEAQVDWTLTWPDGETADFTDLSEEDGFAIKVRISGCDGSCPRTEIDGEIVDAETGRIRFDIPPGIAGAAGIYLFSVALLVDDVVKFTSGGMLVVERGMWGSDDCGACGPPTLNEIRIHLRDRSDENTLLGEVEFDDTEIVNSIIRPIQEFNERTPVFPHKYQCCSFPYRFHWRQAIVGELLMIAAHHYMRNKLQSASAGLSVDDKAKDRDYFAMARAYRAEWLDFVDRTKLAANEIRFGGRVG